MNASADSGAPRQEKWRIATFGTLLAAAGVAAYSRTLSGPFLFDDTTSITNNPSIRHLASSLRPPAGTTVSGRPVLNLSLAINHAVSGVSPWSYHALNLVIHVLAGLTLFGIVRRTFELRRLRPSTTLAFVAALLWMLHPLLTESVTYVVQRAESLMGLFYLLTIYFLIRGAGAPGLQRSLWYAGSCIACFLGMGTKEVMVTAPLVALLYDRTFLAGSFSEALRRRRWVYGVQAAAWLLLLFEVVGAHGRAGTAGFGSGLSCLDYGRTQLPAVAHYLRLSFWPQPLVFDYGVAIVHGFAQFAPSAAVIAALLLLTLWALYQYPALGFLGASFFLILAPSSSFIPVATETMAEHRMYLSLALVVVFGVVALHKWLGRAAVPIGLVLAVALAFATWGRNEDYQSGERMWRDTVAKAPDNERAHSNLGDILDAGGRTNEALVERLEALRLAPDSAAVHNNLGTTLVRVPGKLPDAIIQFEEALRLNPNYAEADINLGIALDAEGRRAEAVELFKNAIRINPDFVAAHNNLGNALARMPGRLDEAVREYETALRLDPDYTSAHNNLGSALAKMPGRQDEAVAQFEEALRLDPNFATAHANLGNALALQPGKLGEAISQYEEAVRLRPDIVELRLNLATMLLGTPGRSAEAADHLRAALRLDPGNARARQMLEQAGQAQD
jgi:protein O-mannosyl-transferase